MLIELLFARCYVWRATIENRSEIGDFAPTRSLWLKFQVEGVAPTTHFCTVSSANEWMPYNFAADSVHSKKLCSRLSSSEMRFYTEIGRFVFLRPPSGDLRATYDDHLRLIGKRVVDFLLVLIELFSLGVTAKAPSTPATCRSNMSKQQATCGIRRSTCRKKLNMFNLFRHVKRMKKSFDMLPKTATCRTATFDMSKQRWTYRSNVRHVASTCRIRHVASICCWCGRKKIVRHVASTCCWCGRGFKLLKNIV